MIRFSGRQGAISTMKVTNNLLAAVLILTVVPPYVGFIEPALEYCCSLISQKLQEKEVCLLNIAWLFRIPVLTNVMQVSLTAAPTSTTSPAIS